jgi:hypothetical protein
MPNCVEQELHVVGSKVDVDEFVRTGYLPRNKGQFDNLLDLHRLCPLKRREAKTTYTHDSAVVLVYHRTRTQAHFSMITSSDYPAEFYARLAVHWPTLAFVCSVNEEMGSFGGIVMVLDGEVTNLVEDYGDAGYSRRKQGRRIRSALDTWSEFLTSGRDWRLVADEPWNRKSIPVDAHFDDDFWFYFNDREEMVNFRMKYGGAMPLRRVGGEWKRTRA